MKKESNRRFNVSFQTIISLIMVITISVTVPQVAMASKLPITAEQNQTILTTTVDNDEAIDGTEQLDTSKSKMEAYVEDYDATAYSVSEIVASGECGENGNNMTWELDSGGTLTIQGTGYMAYYQRNGDIPWNGYADKISNVNLDIITDKLCSRANAYAFGMLFNVKEIKIPEGVIEIPESRNLFPTSLRKLILPSTYAGDLSNNNLIKYTHYLDIEVAVDNPTYSSLNGTLFNKDKTKLIQYTRCGIEPNYIIPETVVDINNAFLNNTLLHSLTISKNVEIIDDELLNNHFDKGGLGMSLYAPSCEAVYVDEENPYFCSVDGVLYNKDMSILIWCPSGKTGHHDIPDSVKIIAAGAFQYSKCAEIQIPNGVEILGRDAFSNVYWKTIVIPKSVKTIYNGCFFGCSQLTSVRIEASDEIEFGTQVFDECHNLQTAGPIGSGSNIEFCWVEIIPEQAFSDCSSLLNVIIPAGITTIKNDAFYGCSGLQELLIPNSVQVIEEYAFGNCKSLTDINIDKVEGTISDEPWSAYGANITYLRNIQIAPITKSFIYTGNVIMQTIHISESKSDTLDSNMLVEGKDYILSYLNNKDVGTATVTVTYIGEYENLHNDELTFSISPKDCGELLVVPIPNQMYTNKEITPNPTIIDNI